MRPKQQIIHPDVGINYPHEDQVKFILQWALRYDDEILIDEGYIHTFRYGKILYVTRAANDHQFVDITIDVEDENDFQMEGMDDSEVQYYLYCRLKPGGEHIDKAVLIHYKALRVLNSLGRFTHYCNSGSGNVFRVFSLQDIEDLGGIVRIYKKW